MWIGKIRVRGGVKVGGMEGPMCLCSLLEPGLLHLHHLISEIKYDSKLFV
jgi:hypothetical protein